LEGKVKAQCPEKIILILKPVTCNLPYLFFGNVVETNNFFGLT